MKTERLANGLLLAAVGVALWSQLTALAPSRGAAPEFTSDAAVSVLMANDAHWDAFRLYYYGQDRLGAWPFWVAHVLGRLFGIVWTPDALYLCQALWLFSGLAAAALLSRRRPLVGGAAYLFAIALPGLVRTMLADLSQPYAWQLPALLWAWLALRAWAERRWRGWIGAVAAAVPQLLAIWISTLSAPMLAAVALLELWRVRRDSRPGWVPAARVLAPVAIGTAAEGSLRALYHHEAIERFRYPFATHLRFDWGHLATNGVAVARRLAQWDCWPVLAAAVAVGGLAAWILRDRALDAEKSEVATLAGGLSTLALLPIPVLICVSHVRENLFNERYFTPTLCFSRAAVVVGVALAAAALSSRASAWLGAVIAACALACAVVFRPGVGPSPVFAQRSREAAALAQRAPGSPLVNAYWRSYVYAALVPPRALVALPLEGDYGRTPFDLDLLRAAATVVVGNAGPLGALVGAPWLWEYGVPLHLLEPQLYSDGSEAFALYENASRRGLPFQASGTTGDWRLGPGERPVEIHFAAAKELEVRIERYDLKSALPEGLRVSAAGGSIRSETMPSGFVVRLETSEQPLESLTMAATEEVRLRGLLLSPATP